MRGKKTTFDDLLKISKEIYNGFYTYDKNSFLNRRKDGSFKITCPNHGDFYLTYSNHILNGRICPQCAEEKNKEKHRQHILSKLNEAKIIHDNFYTYDKVDLDQSVRRHVIITCPIHGDFKMSLENHIRGKCGCSKCAHVYRRTIEESQNAIDNQFGINRFQINPQTYEKYSKKCIIKCLKCGEEKEISVQTFLCTLGCQKCDNNDKEDKYLSINEIYNRYPLPKEISIISRDKKNIILRCSNKDNLGREHGVYTYRLSNIRKYSHHGCPLCAKSAHNLTTSTAIRKLEDKFGTKFDFSKFEHTDKDSVVICPVHGEFLTTYKKMYHSIYGCPQCSNNHNYYETQLKENLKTYLGEYEVVYNVRPQGLLNEETGKSMELDIFYPNLKIAIEYQGRHHFTNNFGDKSHERTIVCDKKKFEICKKMGIKMFYFTFDKRDLPSAYLDKIYTNHEELKKEIIEYIRPKTI